MNIKNISKNDGQVVMTLNKDELTVICNTMYYHEKAGGDEAKRELFHRVYADLILAKDLCQYGHIDDFSFSCITRERKNWVNKYEKSQR